jgi:hypothetical protein
LVVCIGNNTSGDFGIGDLNEPCFYVLLM